MAGHARSRVGRARRRVPSRRRDVTERGSVLVLALIVITIVGVAGVAVLKQESSAPNAQKAYRTARDTQFTADSAADGAIQKMRLDATFGKDGGTGRCSARSTWDALGTYTVNGKTVYVQCEPQQGSAAPAVPPDIWSYALFGLSEVYFAGDVSGTGRGQITGNIGVNKSVAERAPLNPNEGAAQICDTGALTMTAGSALVADSINSNTPGKTISKPCTLSNVFTNQAQSAPWTAGATVTGTWKTPLTRPLFASSDPSYPLPWPGHASGVPGIPATELGACNAARPITVNAGTTVTLNGVASDASATPGAYGAVEVKVGGTLKLKGERYKFCTFKGNSGGAGHSLLQTVAGSEVEIRGDMYDQGGWVLGPDDAQFFIASQPPFVNGATETLYLGAANSPEVHGTFIVPWGKIYLGNGSSLFGHFWGEELKGGQNANVNQGGAPPPGATDRVAKLVVCAVATTPCPGRSALLSVLASFTDTPRAGRAVNILSWVRNP